MSLEKYLSAMDSALQSSGAHHTYFPPDKELRRQRCFSLAREIGHALADFDEKEVGRVLQTLYSRLLVKHTFDSTGVPMDAKEWFDTIRQGIVRGKESHV